MSKITWNDAQFKEAVETSLSYAEIIRKLGLNPAGGNYGTVKRKIKELGLDISHMTGQGWNQGNRYRPVKPHQPLSEILVKDSTWVSTYALKNRLLKEKVKEYRCEKCGRTGWEGHPIPLELHHINGIKNDLRLENLQMLCPNCHSLTDNYRGKNINKINKEETNIDLNESKKDEITLLVNNIKKDDQPKLLKTKPKKHKIKQINICPVCGKEFTSKKSDQKYCSQICYQEDTKGNRPTLIQLIKDFKELKSFVQVGIKYSVTDNAVRKWCRLYGLPIHTKELALYINQFN